MLWDMYWSLNLYVLGYVLELNLNTYPQNISKYVMGDKYVMVNVPNTYQIVPNTYPQYIGVCFEDMFSDF